MRVKLIKIIQELDARGKLVKEMEVTVKYDEKARQVATVSSIKFKNVVTGENVNATHFLSEQFPGALNEIIDSIDWADLYAVGKETIALEN